MYEKLIKRGIDIILSFIGLIFLIPILCIISLIIYIDDPGPIFFKQERFGKHKQMFWLHKLRSMKVDTPDIPTHLLENPEKYITRFGKITRRFSLDELPQLVDIFLGKMSIIGPRPALWNQDDLIAERDKYGANDILPGLTGWAQINGRNELPIDVKAKLDGEYAAVLRKGGFAAFAMDVKCFFKTIAKVIQSEDISEEKHIDLMQEEKEMSK